MNYPYFYAISQERSSKESAYRGVHSDTIELYIVMGAYFKFNAFQGVMREDWKTGLNIVVF
jgi:hypothetical protein